MLIIVEGPDGAGKTTFISALSKIIAQCSNDNIRHYHAGPPRAHPLFEYEETLYNLRTEYRPLTGNTIICDRWHIGEFIYPHIFNRESHMTLSVWRHINLFLASRGAVVVHVDATTATLIDRINARGDDLVSPDQTVQAALMYRDVMDVLPSIPYVRYMSGIDDLSDFIKNLITKAYAAEKMAAKLNTFHTYVGPPNPKYLLLGDVRSHLRYDISYKKNKMNATPAALHDPQPAFMPFAGTPGHLLLSHIPDSLANLYGLANACDVDDLASLFSSLGSPKTIALGNNAWNQVRSRLDHPNVLGHVNHPQYIWRHKSNDVDEYIKHITQLLS